MNSSCAFDPTAIVSLADAVDVMDSPNSNMAMKEAIREQVETVIEVVTDYVNKYHWIGGFYFTQEWAPFMVSIMDNLTIFIDRLRSETPQRRLTYEDLVVMIGVIYDIRCSVMEKNKVIQTRIAQQERYRNHLFEPIDCELFRKLGEMAHLSRMIYYLELYQGLEEAGRNHLIRIRNLEAYQKIGKKRSLGLHSNEDIVSMMPLISDGHIYMLLNYWKNRAQVSADMTELDKLVESDAKAMGEKMMRELVTMATFLAAHGHSQRWKEFVINKVDESRPIIQRGGHSSELKDTIQNLNLLYYRTRHAYDKKKALVETPVTFRQRATDYH